MNQIIVKVLFIMIIAAISGDYSNHTMTGRATWYGTGQFLGNRTPGGIICDGKTPMIAHKTLPYGAVVRITNTSNNKSTIAIVTDRGPFKPGRVVDFNALWQINRICDNKYKKCTSVKHVKLEVINDTYACGLNKTNKEAFRCLSDERVAYGTDGKKRRVKKRLESDEIRALGLTWFK